MFNLKEKRDFVMGTGQMMLTIGAIILLGTIILRMNMTNSHVSDTFLNTKIAIRATAVANSMMQEIVAKNFDENGGMNVNNLTLPGQLGPETGEVYPNFNDVDDYRGLSILIRADSTQIDIDDFNVNCRVFYVNPPNLMDSVGFRTLYKRIIIDVRGTGTDTLYNIPVQISQVQSYVTFW